MFQGTPSKGEAEDRERVLCVGEMSKRNPEGGEACQSSRARAGVGCNSCMSQARDQFVMKESRARVPGKQTQASIAREWTTGPKIAVGRDVPKVQSDAEGLRFSS